VREGLLVVFCIALLFAAGGLLLWQWAKRRQTRQATERHLNQQILASAAAAAAVPMPLRDLPNDGFVAGVLKDPWLETEASAAAAAKPTGSLEKAMPDWLVGVIEPRTAVLVLAAIVVVAALVGLFAGWIGALGVALLLGLLAVFAVWLRLQKFRRKLISQLPGFIDAMVRLITIGNSTQAAFQLAIATTKLLCAASWSERHRWCAWASNWTARCTR
jgi:tight adherence protein B